MKPETDTSRTDYIPSFLQKIGGPNNYPIIEVPKVKARGKGLDLLDYRRKSYAKKKGTQRVPLLNTTGRQHDVRMVV